MYTNFNCDLSLTIHADSKVAKQELDYARREILRIGREAALQRKQMTDIKKEHARWGTQMQLKLTKFAGERKRVSQHNIIVTERAARHEAEICDLKGQIAQQAEEKMVLRARVAWAEKEAADLCGSVLQVNQLTRVMSEREGEFADRGSRHQGEIAEIGRAHV